MRLALRYGDKERDIPNSKYICSTLNRPTLKGGELPRNRRAPSLRVPPESVRQGDVADDDGSPTIGQGGTGTTSCGSRGPPKASERRGGGVEKLSCPQYKCCMVGTGMKCKMMRLPVRKAGSGSGKRLHPLSRIWRWRKVFVSFILSNMTRLVCSKVVQRIKNR